jgi:hypothetical protein
LNLVRNRLYHVATARSTNRFDQTIDPPLYHGHVLQVWQLQARTKPHVERRIGKILRLDDVGGFGARRKNRGCDNPGACDSLI